MPTTRRSRRKGRKNNRKGRMGMGRRRRGAHCFTLSWHVMVFPIDCHGTP